MGFITNSHYVAYNSAGYKANTTHFPNFGGTNIIALTQWQYWWWFWFTFLLCLYFVITLRILQTRTLALHPKIATTLRSRGRWGDLIICAVPIFWCANILSNSHFLLRHLEWQTENSLFSLRVRGKQWYWVYKFDLRAYYDINEAYIIIGRNKRVKESATNPEKWSLLNNAVNYPYTKRDRAEDPFDKVNMSQSRNVNNNLYNVWTAQSENDRFIDVNLFSCQTLGKLSKTLDCQTKSPLTDKSPTLVDGERSKYFIRGFYKAYLGEHTSIYPEITPVNSKLFTLKTFAESFINMRNLGAHTAPKRRWITVLKVEQPAGGYKELYERFNWDHHLKRQGTDSLGLNQYISSHDLNRIHTYNSNLVKSALYWKHLTASNEKKNRALQSKAWYQLAALESLFHNNITSLATIGSQIINHAKISKLTWFVPNEYDLINMEPMTSKEKHNPCKPCVVPARRARMVTKQMMVALRATQVMRIESLSVEVDPVISQFLDKSLVMQANCGGATVKQSIKAPLINSRNIVWLFPQSGALTHKLFLKHGQQGAEMRTIAAVLRLGNTSLAKYFRWRILEKPERHYYTALSTSIKAQWYVRYYFFRNYPHTDRLVHLTAKHWLILTPRDWHWGNFKFFKDHTKLITSTRLLARTSTLLRAANHEIRQKQEYYNALDTIIASRTPTKKKLNLHKAALACVQLGELRHVSPKSSTVPTSARYIVSLAQKWTKEISAARLEDAYVRVGLRLNEYNRTYRLPECIDDVYVVSEEGKQKHFNLLKQVKAGRHPMIPSTVLKLSPRSAIASRQRNKFYISEYAYISPTLTTLLKSSFFPKRLFYFCVNTHTTRMHLIGVRRVEKHFFEALFKHAYYKPSTHRYLTNLTYHVMGRIPLNLKKNSSGLHRLFKTQLQHLHRLTHSTPRNVLKKNKDMWVLYTRLLKHMIDLKILTVADSLPVSRFRYINVGKLLSQAAGQKVRNQWALLDLDQVMDHELRFPKFRSDYVSIFERGLEALNRNLNNILINHCKKNTPSLWCGNQPIAAANAHYAFFTLQKDANTSELTTPLTKHRWFKNNFTRQHLISLHKVPRSDTGENKLLKLTFGETTNQIRDLNSNARITFIQKKAEPINFTKAIDKKQLTLSSHLATRENHLILKDAKKGDIGKVAIRKNMLNTSPSKKKLAYRREIYHNKRLLWVTKQIILPIKTPITIITNSYDVIHSWFIPGLGLKMDCVPGRSTHHTIFIDRPGYYYGQCAEVCGRRHHHMPIKILAVPFVHFIYWWNNRVRAKAREILNTKN